MNRKQFQRLSALRLREAKVLLSAKSPNGAYYLAGYAVECALKACIAKRTEKYEFPEKQRVVDSHSHDPVKLIRVADLEGAHRAAIKEKEFAQSWEIVLKWSSERRYTENSVEEAEALIEAIENRKYGVFQWVRKYW